MWVIWRWQALSDLRALHEYIARNNPPAAARIAERIRQAATQLATFPHRGRPGRTLNTRELIVIGTPYLVIYQTCRDTIHVLRILHGRQRWP